MKHPGSTSSAASAVGRGNTKTDTKPELAVRSILHRCGLRFRKNYWIPFQASGGVRADIAFTKHKLAVFVDGCFWHRCPQHGTEPQSNSEYWEKKLDRNVARDSHVNRELSRTGWRVLRFWEHTSPDRIAEIVHREFSAST
jgi:DNA mismatch endonuclease, patch repair protein